MESGTVLFLCLRGGGVGVRQELGEFVGGAGVGTLRVLAHLEERLLLSLLLVQLLFQGLRERDRDQD